MKQVKMIRVLEYIGPESWVDKIRENNYVKEVTPVIFNENPQQQIRELLLVVEELP